MPTLFYQQKAEPVFTGAPAAPVTVDRFAPTYPQPLRRAFVVAAVVAGVVAPVSTSAEAARVDKVQPTYPQPSRAVRYAAGTTVDAPESTAPETVTVDRWTPTLVQPSRAVRSAAGTTEVRSFVTVTVVVPPSSSWAPTFVQPSRAVRYAAGAFDIPESTARETTRVDKYQPTFVQPSRAIRYAPGLIVRIDVAPPALATFTATAGAATLAATVTADVPGGSSAAFAATACAATLGSTYTAAAAPSAATFAATAGAATLAASLAPAAGPSAATFAAGTTATLASTYIATVPGGSTALFAAPAGPAALNASLLAAARFSFAASTTATLASTYTAAAVIPPTTFAFAAPTRATLALAVASDNPLADDLKQAIVAAVLASTSITDLVAHRIYPDTIPQLSTRGPVSIAYWFVSSNRDSHLTNADGWAWTRVRFRLQGDRLAEVEDLKRRLRRRFQGLLQGLGPVRVVYATCENEADGYDPPLPGSDLGIHYKQLDFRFKHQESLPETGVEAVVIPIPDGSLEGDDLKQAIVAAVLAAGAITTIVEHRIYPDTIPQLTTRGLTALAYSFADAGRDGHLTDADGWVWTRVRFRVQGDRLAEVEALKRRLRRRFQGLLNALGPIRVAFVTCENESDGYDPPPAGSDLGIHYKNLDFRFKHQESLPNHL